MSLRRSAVLLLLLGIVAVALSDLIDADRIPAYRDLLHFVVPFKYFLSEHLRAGHVPLWNPWIYLGTPFLASLQSGVFYPPSVLLLLPFPLGFNVFLLAHFFIALTGFWLLLLDRRLTLAATSLGALTYALGGFLISTVNVTNNLQACVWTPWVLLFWRRQVERPSRAGLVLTASAIGVQILGGAPEVLMMTLATAALWTAWDTLPRWRDCVRRQALLVAAVAIAAGLTAFQVVPTLEYIGQSARVTALPFDEVSVWSLQPVSLLQLVFPYSASLAGAGENSDHLLLESVPPWIHSFYLGLVPLCFVASGLVVARERSFWGAMMLAAVVLALGVNTPLFAFLYQAAPWIIGKFRYPEKFYFLVHLSAAVLAGHGADACFRDDARAQRIACTAAATLTAVALALLCLRWSWPESYLQLVAILSGRYRPITEYVPIAINLDFKAQRVVLILASFLAVVVFRRMSVMGPTTTAILVTALAATDLASTNYGLNWGVSWSGLQAERPVVDVDELRGTRQRLFLYQTVSDPFPGQASKPIQGLEHWTRTNLDSPSFEAAARELWRLLFIDIPMVHGVGTLSGGDGITRSSDNTLRDELAVVPRHRAVKILKIYATAYFLGPEPLDSSDLERIEEPGSRPFFVYRVKEPVPPVYLASRLRVAPKDVDAFNHMIDPGFRPGADATVEELPAGWQDHADSQSGEVVTRRWENERIELEVRAAESALLVVNSSFYPGWQARIDGVAAPIVRTNALVQGILIGPGEHRVELRYRPQSLAVGASISFLTIAGLLGLWLAAPAALAVSR